jgi:diguanylate cyclase (GGDEF)-like protein/PAS domain S-box-containing protein
MSPHRITAAWWREADACDLRPYSLGTGAVDRAGSEQGQRVGEIDNRSKSRSVAEIGAVLLVLLASLSVLLVLSRSAEAHHAIALRTSRLETVAENLDANVWKARAEGGVTVGVDQAVDADLVAAEGLITNLSTDAQVVPAFVEYRDALRVRFDLTRTGDTAAAIDVDESRVEPAFQRLRVVLEANASVATDAATRATKWQNAGSIIVLAVAGGLLLLIMRRVSRARVHGAELRERSRVTTESEQRFRLLIQNIADGILAVDGGGHVSFATPTANVFLGLADGQLVGRDLSTLGIRTDQPILSAVREARAAVTPAVLADWCVIDVDGHDRVLEPILTRDDSDPSAEAVLITLRDVTEHKMLEHLLSHRAAHDPLTGLANRYQLIDAIAAVCADHNRSTNALVFIDLDDFKNVNDTAGHTVGDDLLRAVGERLRQAVGPGDLAARLGGDEFAVLLRDLPSRAAGALTSAKDILAVFGAPFSVRGLELELKASLGIAYVGADDEGATVEELLRDADIAMYNAKAAGKGQIQVFEPAMHRQLERRVQLGNDLVRAVRDDKIAVHYQPIVDIGDGGVVGFEALARWDHPGVGDIPPTVFIPLAEEMGLVCQIGRNVLNTACGEAAAWRRALGHDYPVSVNVSARHFDEDLLTDVRVALDRAQLPPDLLTIEITESVLQGREHAAAALTALRQLGVHISLDDFGTGYSALAYLRDFPLDEIKIDRSFINNLQAESGARLVKTIIDLAHAMHVSTVAEGIERPEQADVLQGQGCTRGQGFLYAKALRPDQVVAHLLAGTSAGRAPSGGLSQPSLPTSV